MSTRHGVAIESGLTGWKRYGCGIQCGCGSDWILTCLVRLNCTALLMLSIFFASHRGWSAFMLCYLHAVGVRWASNSNFRFNIFSFDSVTLCMCCSHTLLFSFFSFSVRAWLESFQLFVCFDWMCSKLSSCCTNDLCRMPLRCFHFCWNICSCG